MQHKTLTASDILTAGAEYHFARTVLSRSKPKSLHDHDYFELFWLHNGRARHFIGDEKSVLTEGDLVFVRPKDVHALQGIGEESHLVNIVIPGSQVSNFCERHPTAKPFFMPDSDAPKQVHLDIRALGRLSHRAVALEAAPRTSLHLEAFLLPLIAELSLGPPSLPTDAPAWLASALNEVRSPDVFRDGAAGLARVSGKAHAHVSRTVQRYMGETPSNLINRTRMNYAARQLVGTPDALTEIAEEVGISNMSHFHRLFRNQFGMTPRQYRVKHQKSVVQPV